MSIELNVPILSSDWTQHQAEYDCVIVGSGYGGSIIAARLTGAPITPKPSVCLLERGREWPMQGAGKFPDTFQDFTDNLRDKIVTKNPLGLYDIINATAITVLKGNGLGGTSLINANVAIIPEDFAFQQSGWPPSLNRASLQPYYDRAAKILRPNPFPANAVLRKRYALDARAAQLHTTTELLNIVVTFDDTPDNGCGIAQPACTKCGDCVTGCNVGSKNTLYMNYLPLASRNGAKIFTQSEVQWIEPRPGGGWIIHGVHRPDQDSEESFQLAAGRVILSAGSINSTEILLRSASHGLSVSPKVGTGFSGNGDFFGISYNGPALLEGLGFGNHPKPDDLTSPPGPTITTILRYTQDANPANHFIVEDVSFPTALMNTAQGTFPWLLGEDFGGGWGDKFQRASLDISQADPYSEDGALNHSMLYLVNAFDNAQGKIVLKTSALDQEGEADIVWPGAGSEAIFQKINAELRESARALSSRFVENPTWSFLGLRRLITAHPLGGCPIGVDAQSGAVTEYGQVFAADGSILPGLRVVDGSLTPSALGVNPLFTISALAERIAEHQINELAQA